MEIVRWTFIIIFMLIFLGFALQNQTETVSVKILNWQTNDLPLYFFLYMAFGVGLLTATVIALVQNIKLRAQMVKLQRENNKIKDELDRQRNASIDDDDKTAALAESPTDQGEEQGKLNE